MLCMKTLYVGCALRGAPAEFVASVEALKRELEAHFEVLHFIGISPTATAREIYETDIDCAARADLMLAICDMPSTGLGMEIGKRLELKKPTVMVYHKDVHVSVMVLGLAESVPGFAALSYETHAEVLEHLKTLA